MDIMNLPMSWSIVAIKINIYYVLKLPKIVEILLHILYHYILSLYEIFSEI